MGVRQPPMLDIRKIKNTMMWLRRLRQEFILISGRTISMLAPVVPTQLDSNVPNIKGVFDLPRRYMRSSGQAHDSEHIS